MLARIKMCCKSRQNMHRLNMIVINIMKYSNI